MPTETSPTARAWVVGWVAISLLLSLASCATTPAVPVTAPLSSDLLHAEPWPEADALFRSDPRWLGADDAYSVDLGGRRVLWLFADTFVSTRKRDRPGLLPARRTADKKRRDRDYNHCG